VAGHSQELPLGSAPVRDAHTEQLPARRPPTRPLVSDPQRPNPRQEGNAAGLELRGLGKRFGDRAAVDGVNLSIGAGELMVLLGPSGSGKTTLLRMVAGLEAPTGGEIRIAGERMDADTPPRARGIAMVFQSYALYPHRTVFQNIAFPLEAIRLPRRQIEEKVRWAAEMFHIDAHLERYPRQLSGGERQRVALCRALVRDPKLFLFDEPLASLDAKLRHTARDELKRFQRRIGIACLYVTHDQIEAMGLGDRIAVMHAGKLRQVGTPLEIYQDPADTFVATFIGQPPMNLIGPGDATRPPRTLLGFRPEDFRPRAVFADGEEFLALRFHVVRIEYLGSDRYAYGTIPASGSPDATVIARLPGASGPRIGEGETHEFAVSRRAIRYFDAATGARRLP
jgi:multiple sugar transport system ATP-binding protein